MATLFRAIGVAAKRLSADAYSVTVDLVKVVDGTPEPGERKVLRVSDLADLKTQCDALVQTAKAHEIDADLTAKIVGKVVASA